MQNGLTADTARVRTYEEMDYSQLLADVERILTILALTVGGVVSWIKFVGGRTDKIRLEPTISGEFIEGDEKYHLLITMVLTNKGLFVANVPKGGFHLEVLAPKTHLESLQIQDTEWENETAFRVFINHTAIQTGESACEQLRLTVTKDRFAALQLKLRVTDAGRKLWILVIRQGTEWEAMTIINLPNTAKPLII